MLKALEQIAAQLESITLSATAAYDAVATSMGGVVEKVTAADAAVRSASASMTSQARETSDRVASTLDTVRRTAEEARQTVATRLDDLQEAVSDHTNLWNKAVSELIDAVKIGAEPIEHLLDLYGDAMIGGQRLSEYLKGLNLDFYERQVEGLVRGLNDGTVEIGRVLDYLGQTQLTFAKQLVDVIELFRQGKVTLKRVEEIVRQIQKLFPESEFGDLAEALTNALRRGDL